MENSYRISEIFGPTIQGEGALTGVATVFVRAGGCDFRCSWCDSLHAVLSEHRHDWAKMSADDIMAQVEALSGDEPLMVSLSGGNPAIQDFKPLITLGQQKGYRFAMETQGSVARDWFSSLDMVVLSPKPPSSGETMDEAIFKECIEKATGTETVLKIVIFDETDYQWAKEFAGKYSALPLYLQPGNHTPPSSDENDAPIDMDGIMERYRWLIDRTMKDQWFRPRITPQLHVLVWGNLRGV